MVIRSLRVLTLQGLGPASIHIRDGRIVRVSAYADTDGEPVRDFGDHVVMPGIVEPHVHVNEPGRTAWEGFGSLTRAAAAGGVTTIVDMPLNSIPPTTTVPAFQAKAEAARGQCWVEVGFWGGAVPGNVAELSQLQRLGLPGFKCFLVPSGVPEFGHLTEYDLRAAMAEISRIGAVLLAHAELPGPIERATSTALALDSRTYGAWLASRPPEAEHEAIALLIRLAKESGCHVHVVHLSSAGALDMLAEARATVPLTVETCPHYLTFCAEDIPDGATPFKCAPPIRTADNRERLWEGLRSGIIDIVACDHSPCTPDLKLLEEGDFTRAWGGIASLGLSLSATWTEARARGFGLADLSRWMSQASARLAGLSDSKGSFEPGHDADIVVWDPDATFCVEGRASHHRHPITPYEGRTLAGVVYATFLRGQQVYADGEVTQEPAGRLLVSETLPSGQR